MFLTFQASPSFIKTPDRGFTVTGSYSAYTPIGGNIPIFTREGRPGEVPRYWINGWFLQLEIVGSGAGGGARITNYFGNSTYGYGGGGASGFPSRYYGFINSTVASQGMKAWIANGANGGIVSVNATERRGLSGNATVVTYNGAANTVFLSTTAGANSGGYGAVNQAYDGTNPLTAYGGTFGYYAGSNGYNFNEDRGLGGSPSWTNYELGNYGFRLNFPANAGEGGNAGGISVYSNANGNAGRAGAVMWSITYIDREFAYSTRAVTTNGNTFQQASPTGLPVNLARMYLVQFDKGNASWTESHPVINIRLNETHTYQVNVVNYVAKFEDANDANSVVATVNLSAANKYVYWGIQYYWGYQWSP